MNCEELWGTDCQLPLTPELKFRCAIVPHCHGKYSDIIKAALDEGFAPRAIASLTNDKQDIRPDADLINYVADLPEGLRLLAESDHTPAPIIVDLAKTQDAAILVRLAANRRTHPDILDELSNSDHLEIRIKVAQNTNCAPETLANLLLDPNFEIQRSLALNISSPRTLLEEGLQGGQKTLRPYLIQNKSLPPEFVATIAADENSDLRTQAALHRNIDSGTLSALAHDDDWRVRYAAAGSPVADTSILTKLANDPRASVRSSVALNASTPQQLLEALLGEDDYVVRYRMAQNPQLPLDIFTKLILDEHASVRRILTTNSTTPFFYSEFRMNELIEHESPYAWTALLSLQEVPETIKTQLRSNAKNQIGISINEFAQSNLRNIYLLADLVSDASVTCDTEALFAILSFLCRKPKDPDRIETVASRIIATATIKSSARSRIKATMLKDFAGDKSLIHSILRRSQAA